MSSDSTYKPGSEVRDGHDTSDPGATLQVSGDQWAFAFVI
jgi:hypothetical protein